ncbi:MAG: hypothetical protein ACI9S8_001577 [Chlamydiales bacterium]|jgi:hypothetical protein
MELIRGKMISNKGLQACTSVLMIRPVSFCGNLETLSTNAFQKKDHGLSLGEIQSRALEEFDNYVKILRSHDVLVHTFEDNSETHTPDSIYPNNWLSVHPDGKILTYPMATESRRLERRSDIIDFIKGHYQITDHHDLGHYASEGRYLEGTGSVVFDYPHKRAYACLSARTDQGLFEELCEYLEYEAISFRAVDAKLTAIYHTNVMMHVGESCAVVCLEVVPDFGEREKILSSLRETGHEVLLISLDQMKSFCANILEVSNHNGEVLLLMSEQARKAYTKQQLRLLEKNTKILSTSLQTIESAGGGGARCMLAGIHAVSQDCSITFSP